MQFTLTVIEGLPLLEAGSFLNYTVYFFCGLSFLMRPITEKVGNPFAGVPV